MTNRIEALYRHPWTIRYLKRPIKLYIWPSFVDGLLVVVAFYAALNVRFTWQVPTDYLRQVSPWIPLVVLIYIAANFGRGIYNRLWRYVTLYDVRALAEASAFATLLLMAIDLLYGNNRPLPLSQVLLGGLLSCVLMLITRCGSFLLVRETTDRSRASQLQDGRIRALIVGAGDHGRRLVRHLRDDLGQRADYEVIGFIDDDQSKVGLRIHGLKVWGTRHEIPALVQAYAIDQIIIVSRTSFGDSFDELVAICQKTPAQIKVMPRFCDLLDEHARFPNLRDLTIEDLLERNPARIDDQTCHQILTDRVILVTGAAGSIGSELCRKLLHFNPRCLLLVDNNETGLHDLHLELIEMQTKNHPTSLYPLAADITNGRKLEAIFDQYRPQIVFHAAAYKHVPMMEIHPDEAVRVNVMGTMLLTELADRFGVERFILISTDKAVNPTCVMGASKRLGEMWAAARQQGSKTCFAAVRFGNVIGSRGSVVPLFNRQIERGGPVTITDPRMTRYFMSIPEAAMLIIQAGAFAGGGEIFMLDMGQPIHIVDMAQKMIRLKGLRVGRDIRIKFIGIRPGEKLHEELSYQTEYRRPTAHPKIYRLENDHIPDRETLLQQIAVLIAASQSNPDMITRLGTGVILTARGDADGCLETLADMRLCPQKRLLPTWSKVISHDMEPPQGVARRSIAVSLEPVVLTGAG